MSFCIENVYFKPYAACRHAHPSIEAVLAIKTEQNIDIDEIESIHVLTYDRVIGKHDHSEVDNVSSAKMSIPYGIAVALLTGKAGILEFRDELIHNVKIHQLLQKIIIMGDKELSKLIPQKRSAILTIKTKNDSVYTKRVDYPKGEPENPLSNDDVNRKFIELSEYADRSANISKEILVTISDLKDDLSELFTRL